MEIQQTDPNSFTFCYTFAFPSLVVKFSMAKYCRISPLRSLIAILDFRLPFPEVLYVTAARNQMLLCSSAVEIFQVFFL